MKPRIPHLIGGSVTALVAAGTLALGGTLLTHQDDGYLQSGSHAFDSDAAAIVSGNIAVDLEGAERFFDDDEEFGTVRLRVEPDGDGKPLFVGVAPTKDVERYLDGVAHSTLDDVDYPMSGP